MGRGLLFGASGLRGRIDAQPSDRPEEAAPARKPGGVWAIVSEKSPAKLKLRPDPDIGAVRALTEPSGPGGLLICWKQRVGRPFCTQGPHSS